MQLDVFGNWSHCILLIGWKEMQFSKSSALFRLEGFIQHLYVACFSFCFCWIGLLRASSVSSLLHIMVWFQDWHHDVIVQSYIWQDSPHCSLKHSCLIQEHPSIQGVYEGQRKLVKCIIQASCLDWCNKSPYASGSILITGNIKAMHMFHF